MLIPRGACFRSLLSIEDGVIRVVLLLWFRLLFSNRWYRRLNAVPLQLMTNQFNHLEVRQTSTKVGGRWLPRHHEVGKTNELLPRNNGTYTWNSSTTLQNLLCRKNMYCSMHKRLLVEVVAEIPWCLVRCPVVMHPYGENCPQLRRESSLSFI